MLSLALIAQMTKGEDFKLAPSIHESPFEALPDEMILAIFEQFTSLSDLGRMDQAASRFRLSNDRLFWQYLASKLELGNGAFDKGKVLKEVERIIITAQAVLAPSEIGSDVYDIQWLKETNRKIDAILKEDLKTLWGVCKAAINDQGPFSKMVTSEGFASWIEVHKVQLQESLKTISFHEQPLLTIPSEIKHLSWLTELSVNRGKLAYISEEIRSLSQLEKLTLRNNAIKTLQPEVTTLPKLSYLDLSGNELQALPDSLKDSHQLKQLWLDGNQLESLPDLGSLKELECFHAENNDLSQIPFATADLKQLKEFCVKGNRIKTVPADLSRLLNKFAPFSDSDALSVDSGVLLADQGT